MKCLLDGEAYDGIRLVFDPILALEIGDDRLDLALTFGVEFGLALDLSALFSGLDAEQVLGRHGMGDPDFQGHVRIASGHVEDAGYRPSSPELFGSKRGQAAMANPEHLAILKQGVEKWNET